MGRLGGVELRDSLAGSASLMAKNSASHVLGLSASSGLCKRTNTLSAPQKAWESTRLPRAGVSHGRPTCLCCSVDPLLDPSLSPPCARHCLCGT